MKYTGEDVWSHVAFAEKALSLAQQAKINTSSNLIWKVRNELPDIIRQKVKETHTTWDDFCKAIKEVDMGHIQDGMKRHHREKKEKDRVESLIASLCHTQQHQQRRQLLPTIPLTSSCQIHRCIYGSCRSKTSTTTVNE